MSKKNLSIVLYLLIYILFGIFGIFIYKDSISLIEGGPGSYLYILALILIIVIFFHSRKRLDSRRLFWINNIVLIIWFIFLTYLWQYGWYVLNGPV